MEINVINLVCTKRADWTAERTETNGRAGECSITALNAYCYIMFPFNRSGLCIIYAPGSKWLIVAKKATLAYEPYNTLLSSSNIL